MKSKDLFKTVYPPASIDILKNSNEIGARIGERIVRAIRENPYAILILPTGSTPITAYRYVVKKFGDDKTLDMSKIIIFNLDEYIGFPDEHPLSYSYYMKKVLYEPLDKIDRNRAPHPNNRRIPFVREGERPSDVAKRYGASLADAVRRSDSGMVDLAVLGVGGAYPVFDKRGRFSKIKGGHIGFNEPGSKVTDGARVVTLTDKTKLDTAFRFLNLKFCASSYGRDFPCRVPDQAITLGIADILESREIWLLANLEEKSPVIAEAYKDMPNPDFPVTFLKCHKNVHWLLDTDAASELPHIKRPWTLTGASTKWSKVLMRKAVLECLRIHPKKELGDIDEKYMADIGVSEKALASMGGLKRIKEDMVKFLRFFVCDKDDNLLPKKEKIIIFSPHPDDDVIDMAATIRKLVERENNVWIVYMVNGENAVRIDLPAARKAFKDIHAKYMKSFPSKKLSSVEIEELWRRARIAVRKKESQNAAKVLGVPENRLIFLDLPYYYHRGMVDVQAIDTEKDVRPVRDLLLQIRPSHVFYSAEADPHGAHGLCAEIVSRALEWLLSFWNCSFWGYRGAYEEWPLEKAEDLIIVPFDSALMRRKTLAIKAHKSQIHPIFPSFDCREFWERARDRNRQTGRVLEQLGVVRSKGRGYAEVFRKIAHAEFMRTK